MESRHVKSINTDQRSKKRIKFASAKERSKRASADVYRSHKRKIGATSAATREAAIHNPRRDASARKRQRSHHLPIGENTNKAAVVKIASDDDEAVESMGLDFDDEAEVLVSGSSLSSEIDETLDRNGSEIFGKFHRQVWPLVRSLPEILHHSKKIVDLMLSYMLSPESSPETPSMDRDRKVDEVSRYVVNHATLEILHLMAVLARDLRHEIHPYLPKILDRLVSDLLNPLPPPPESGKQPIPLDVTVVESAFRCMSYIFRYDSDNILEDIEPMRKYYGATLAARRELTRRLASEAFAPLVRKLKTKNERHRHLKRVFKALAASSKEQKLTPTLRKTQDDAVDGISQLLFQIVRGVPGHLHSQASSTINFVLLYCAKSPRDEIQDANIVLSVAMSFIDRLIRYVRGKTVDDLVHTVSSVLKALLEPKSLEESGSQPAINALKLLARVTETDMGTTASLETLEKDPHLSKSLDQLFCMDFVSSLTTGQREEVLTVACPLWVALESSPRISSCLGKWLRVIFQIDQADGFDSKIALSLRNMTMVLSTNLISSFQDRRHRDLVGNLLLSVAAKVSEAESDVALLSLLSIAKKQPDDEEADDSPFDGLALCRDGSSFTVDVEVYDKLIALLLGDISEEIFKSSSIKRLLVILRCIPFVATLSRNKENESYGQWGKTILRRCSRWYNELIVTVDKMLSENNIGDIKEDLYIVKAFCLEGMGIVSMRFLSASGSVQVTAPLIQPFIAHANEFLFERRHSLWTIRAVSIIVDILTMVDLKLNERINETFDALVSNLSSSSHSLRLNTLKILDSFPAKNFVTDHADLDLEDDLDEERSSKPLDSDSKNNHGPVGICDMISTLRKIEESKVQLTKERPLLGLVSRVEVLARTGKLPVAYAEAAAHHMLGLFYVKFSPLWGSAVKALAALVKGQENVVWPALEEKLVSVMRATFKDLQKFAVMSSSFSFMDYNGHRLACIEWEKSQGRSIAIFGSGRVVEDGEIHKHLTTDDVTVLESVWSVAEKCPHVVAQHSRVIVPAFIDFLMDHFFLYHSNDPIARELDLDKPSNACCVDRALLGKHHLQKKLVCFLRVFAAIDGPQQLVHHQLLEKVFRSFVAHQEAPVVQAAFACLLKFKPKYLVPHQDLLRAIIEKGQLRNGLVKLQEAIEVGRISDEDRRMLVPLLSRLLFGRLAVRESKSGKDSPAARRSAIVSFIALVCKEDKELFPFVYLMIRSFIPREACSLKEVENYSSAERDSIMAALHDTNVATLDLPGGVIEGFLHLLQAAIAQLGHRVNSFVPSVVSIVISVCQYVAIPGELHLEAQGTDDEKRAGGCLRHGAIRTLCYQRMSEIFSTYVHSLDFTSFGDRLWGAIKISIQAMPEMVTKAERPPALLHLVDTMSQDPRLMNMLFTHEMAVISVIKCVASTTFDAVMNIVLSIIERLLDKALSNPNERLSQVFSSHIPLLMERFVSRIQSNGSSDTPESSQVSKRRRFKLRKGTWRKELLVLFRTSELLGQNICHDIILDDLTELLLPYLEPGQGTSDEDKINVLGILGTVSSRLGSHSLALIFETISTILGPNRDKVGIESIPVRGEVAGLLERLGALNEDWKEISRAVSNLSAVNARRVDEVDFEKIIPELNLLGRDDECTAWGRLGGECPQNLAPILSVCFHYLHNEDGVLARASFNALKTFLRFASKQVSLQYWSKTTESLIIPQSRAGLQSRSPSIRRFYILIIREATTCFRSFDSLNLCGDMHVLVDDENPDLDFFMGITHVQIHRRCRALQRLRKLLKENEKMDNPLSSQSLSSVLLPLALHPVYESKTKAEESFALEGIATIGAISRHLPWNKYHNALQSILASFSRHPEQERYLIGALCSIIDAFSFELLAQSQHAEGLNLDECNNDNQKTAVWGALERRIIPKLEALLTKENVDKAGKKSKVIRPSMVLALMKLFQKFPEDFFESKLPHILTVICDSLRNRDSDIRDVARSTMAKIATCMDLKYLADIMRELMITLNEGFKLHVRSATVHAILQELQQVYKPSISKGFNIGASSFDSTLPAIMEILQEDLFGEANERRESQETNVRYVKEAGGTKSIHSIELACRILQFRPSDAANGGIEKSSIHCVVSPLLERLRLPDTSAATIRKIRDILSRVVIGLSHNPSVCPSEVFPFVHATVQPYVGQQRISAVLQDDSDDEDEVRGLQVSGSKRDKKKSSQRTETGKVSQWRPSAIKHAQSSKDAIDIQRKERQGLRLVKDGASAPKLTGSDRHGMLDSSTSSNLNDPATICAVVFGLNLLHSNLKTLDDAGEMKAMMDPFVPLLTACICNCRDNDVALVAMKCMMSFLRFKLPSLEKCSKALGTQALSFLSSSGSSLNQNADMTQACFRTLSYLINRDRSFDDQETQINLVSGAEGEQAFAANIALPLNADQMKVLIAFLAVSISESEQHNPALGLIKAILSRKFMSPEFYDLMEAMLKLNVRSQKASLRQQSGGIFIRYLLDYPMSAERFEQHLKQIVANISYEYKEGRLSAIQLLAAVEERLPEELLEQHSQLLFLPQVLQLVNDEAKECRESISKSLRTVLSRCSIEVLQSFHTYMVRWCNGEGPMQVASLQVFAIFCEACSDFVVGHSPQWVERLTALLQMPGQEWETSYFTLICLEKLTTTNLSLLEQKDELWTLIVERLVDSHPWIKLSSCRMVQKIFSAEALKILERRPGMLFDIIRGLCFQLGVDEEDQNDELSENAIKTLVMALPMTKEHPDLCFAEDSPHAGLRDPLGWLLRRLSAIAKPKGRKRRMAVYKCFAAFCSRHPNLVLTAGGNTTESRLYLELMLEPLHRSHLEASNERENPYALHNASSMEVDQEEMTESSLARDILQLIEEACPSEDFLTAYAAVKTRARDKKDTRKAQVKVEQVQDPMGAALKKTQKHQRERERKKRRVEDRRRDRGASKKRRST